jgi:hypothetical protein
MIWVGSFTSVQSALRKPRPGALAVARKDAMEASPVSSGVLMDSSSSATRWNAAVLPFISRESGTQSRERSRISVTYLHDAQLDYFRIADDPGVNRKSLELFRGSSFHPGEFPDDAPVRVASDRVHLERLGEGELGAKRR